MGEARSLEQTYRARILGFFVLVGACRPLRPSHSDGMRTTWRFSSEEEASVLDTPPPSTQPAAWSGSCCMCAGQPALHLLAPAAVDTLIGELCGALTRLLLWAGPLTRDDPELHMPSRQPVHSLALCCLCVSWDL